MPSFRLIVCLLLAATFAAMLVAILPSQRLVAQRGLPPVVQRVLERDTVLHAIPCARTTRIRAEFFESGALAGCFLSRTHTVGRTAYPTGTWLDRTPTGVVWGLWLPAGTRVDGHTCRGEGFKKWRTSLYDDGALASCYLSRDTVIAGVPCRHGSFWGEIRSRGQNALYLHADGRLRQCLAGRDTTLNGERINGGDVVRRP